MDRPLRLLTVGHKPSLNQALAARDDLTVVAMEEEARQPSRRGRVDVLPFRHSAKVSPAAVARLLRVVRNVKPDVVQVYGSRGLAHATLALGAMRGRPPLVSYRGVTSKPSRLRLEDWLTYLSPVVDAHACESQASMEGLLRAGIPAERCFVTFNLLTQKPSPTAPRSALTKFGVPADAMVVAMVANFRRVKGGDVLLEAARRLADLPDLVFLLIGEELDPHLRRLAADPAIAPRTRMVGFRRDAMYLATAADVFVMPSRAEALCVALLEAMSAGVCPVVSDAGGMKEAVRHGVDGLVVPRESPDALAAALRSLHADRGLAHRLGVSARARFAAMFSPAAVAERFVGGYRDLLTRRGGAWPARSA